MAIDKEELEEIASSIAKAVRTEVAAELDKNRHMSRETHMAHHDFVALLMKERQMLNERREAIMRQIQGAGALAAIGAILTALGVWITDFIKRIH